MNKKIKPVEEGKIYEFQIEKLGYNGEGVARKEGLAIFIEGAIDGEVVKAEVTEVKKNFAVAKLIEILRASEYRIAPFCSVYDECGGCQLQHISYEKQLLYKKQQVIDQLEHTAKLKDVIVHDTIGMDVPKHYRNKAQFPVGKLENGNSVLGFYGLGTHNIVPTERCEIQHEVTESICKVLRRFIDENNVSVYDEATGKGVVRHLITRIGFKTGELMIILVTNGEDFTKKELFIDFINKNIEGVKSIVQNINTENTNKIMGNKNILLYGEEYIEDYLCDMKFRISPNSFYQVNPIQTEKLYNKALEYAGDIENSIVVDAYCGIGTISFALAKKAKKVYGIEIVEQAVDDARVNAEINDVKNIEFICGKSEEIMPQIIQKEKIDVVIMDPPRKGCDRTFLEAVASVEPRRIVYVSCNPATLARDLVVLEGLGYGVLEVQPVDMFGWTKHVETCVLLSHKNS